MRLLLSRLNALLFIACALALVWPGPAAAQSPPPTPTPSALDVAGVTPQVTWMTQLWAVLGWLAIPIVIVAALAWLYNNTPLGEYVNTRVGKKAERDDERAVQEAAQRQQAQAQEQALQSGADAYLSWLRDELKHLPIIPIKSAERMGQLQLRDVYVPLRVVERAQLEGFRKLTMGDFAPGGEYLLRREVFATLEQSQRVYHLLSDRDAVPPQLREQGDGAALYSTRLLLIGDAGSGKTTTLHFGALLLAQDCLNNNSLLARNELDLHCQDRPLPFYIRLTLVATYIRDAYERAAPADLPRLQGMPGKLLLDWLDIYTQAQVHAGERVLPADLPSQRIAAGGCLLLLDGLDETGDARERENMQHLITNLVQDYPDNRYIVASRPFETLGLPGFSERHLSPLNEGEMRSLLENWFGAVQQSEGAPRRARAGAAEQVEYLWEILQRNPRLFEMATNPLLLTSMALLVQTGVGLPRERAELYNRLVYLLLETWRIQQVSGGVPGAARARLYGGEESVTSVQRRLQELAAWMQQQQRRELRLSEAQALLRPIYQELMRWHAEQSDDYVHRLLESLALESGLIQRRDGGYSFSHFTLQEYLTARAYDQRLDGIEGLFDQWGQPRWHETLLLAVGHWATSGEPGKARQLLRRLLDTHDGKALLLAANALDDADAAGVLELAPLRDETVARLRVLAFQPARCPDPRLRNQAASLLDRLGSDQRPELDLHHPRYWAQRIAPGPFVMGEGAAAFTFQITPAYSLARFPVTNRQYLAFLSSLAEDEARARRPRAWPGRRYPPGEGNHPVVNVSWEDASAFAQWAHTQWLSDEERARGAAIRLPTEPEWERAAAYPAVLAPESPGAGRREYPWGTWPADVRDTSGLRISDSVLANTRESGIGSTSAVGIFPQGAADCGAEDLAGNVFEWCSTPAYDYPLSEELQAETLEPGNNAPDRAYVMRGGSWDEGQSSARCASRGNTRAPGTFDVGFRLARIAPQ